MAITLHLQHVASIALVAKKGPIQLRGLGYSHDRRYWPDDVLIV